MPLLKAGVKVLRMSSRESETLCFQNPKMGILIETKWTRIRPQKDEAREAPQMGCNFELLKVKSTNFSGESYIFVSRN